MENYGHPEQLIAMVDAGISDPVSARWPTDPTADLAKGRVADAGGKAEQLRDDIGPFVAAVKTAVRNSRQFQNHRLIASRLELDHDAWASAKSDPATIRSLVDLAKSI